MVDKGRVLTPTRYFNDLEKGQRLLVVTSLLSIQR